MEAVVEWDRTHRQTTIDIAYRFDVLNIAVLLWHGFDQLMHRGEKFKDVVSLTRAVLLVSQYVVDVVDDFIVEGDILIEGVALQ